VYEAVPPVRCSHLPLTVGGVSRGSGRCEHKSWHEGLMMGTRHSFGEKIRKIECASKVSDSELTLPNTVSEPMKSHVDAFGPFLFDVICSEAYCKGIIAKYWSGRLFMA
jgi:hypothetical protein